MSFDSNAGGFLRSKDYMYAIRSTDDNEEIDNQMGDDSVEDYLKYGATARPTNNSKARPHHRSERVCPKQTAKENSDANSSDNSFASRLTQHLEKRKKHKRASDFYLPYMRKKNKIAAPVKKKNSMTQLLSNILDKDKNHTKCGSQDNDDDDDMFSFRSSPARPGMAVPNPLRSTSKHNQQPPRPTAITAQQRRSSGLFVKDSASSSSFLGSTPSKPSVSRSSTLQSTSRYQKTNNDMPPSSPINTAMFSESTPMHVRGRNNGNPLSSSPVKRSAFPNLGSLQTFDLHHPTKSKNANNNHTTQQDRSQVNQHMIEQVEKGLHDMKKMISSANHSRNRITTKKAKSKNDQVENVKVFTIDSSDSEDGEDSEDSDESEESEDSDSESVGGTDAYMAALEERLLANYANIVADDPFRDISTRNHQDPARTKQKTVSKKARSGIPSDDSINISSSVHGSQKVNKNINPPTDPIQNSVDGGDIIEILDDDSTGLGKTDVGPGPHSAFGVAAGSVAKKTYIHDDDMAFFDDLEKDMDDVLTSFHSDNFGSSPRKNHVDDFQTRAHRTRLVDNYTSVSSKDHSNTKKKNKKQNKESEPISVDKSTTKTSQLDDDDLCIVEVNEVPKVSKTSASASTVSSKLTFEPSSLLTIPKSSTHKKLPTKKVKQFDDEFDSLDSSSDCNSDDDIVIKNLFTEMRSRNSRIAAAASPPKNNNCNNKHINNETNDITTVNATARLSSKRSATMPNTIPALPFPQTPPLSKTEKRTVPVSSPSNRTEMNSSFLVGTPDEIQVNLYREYTIEELDRMLLVARENNLPKLRKCNLASMTKDEFLSKMKIIMNDKLLKSFELKNSQFTSFLKPVTVESGNLNYNYPIIQFQKFADSVYHPGKHTFIPLARPKYKLEKIIAIWIEAEELAENLNELATLIRRIKEKDGDFRVILFINGYDNYMKSLRLQANRQFNQELRTLNSATGTTTASAASAASDPEFLSDKKLEHKLTDLEIQLGFHTLPLKGLRELIEWLLSISYTLSTKMRDAKDRLEFSNMGGIKSAESTKEIMCESLKQIRSFTNRSANPVVNKYGSLSKMYHGLCHGDEVTGLRSDALANLKMLFLAEDENQLIHM
ncbi:unnamed protein product [Ambrosiozyma monospora]|uniref:Unnamed protein product n=1 Tax=Ambrosiozyma monospora TaxID=43982 RepID=A0A9W6YT58_AMBMO|nr:unnamed protein product [Ambrosiozyma monospora]